MNLYRKLFGMILMAPADDGSGGGAGGAVDRGDSVAASGEPIDHTADDQVDKDLQAATGSEETEGEGERQRDSSGKFTKKDKADGEVAIPKSRFDDAVRKERERAEAAERELAEIRRAQQQIARDVDIGQLEDKVKELRAAERKALIAGEDDKAAEIANEADRLNRQIAIEQARDMSGAAKEAAREEIRWDMTVERIEEQYPQLNESSDEFDQDLTDDVLDKMRGLMTREKLPRSAALLKAVKYIMDRQESAKGDDPTQAKGLNRGKEAGRKEAAVSKNIDAASRQPASTKRVGADSDKFGQTKSVPDADSLTFEEFQALPESTKAKMRGDFI